MRVTFTQYGAAPAPVLTPLAAAPAEVRYWNAVPLAAETSMSANAEFASSVFRIITPAFVQLATFCTAAMRATISPSPVSG